MIDMTIDHGLDALEIVGQQDVGWMVTTLCLDYLLTKFSWLLPLRYLSGFEVANLTNENHI
jgi:hypothetical protein